MRFPETSVLYRKKGSNWVAANFSNRGSHETQEGELWTGELLR